MLQHRVSLAESLQLQVNPYQDYISFKVCIAELIDKQEIPQDLWQFIVETKSVDQKKRAVYLY